MAVIETKYVKWSVRMNLGRLIRGEKIVDWWPDTDVGEMWEVEPWILILRGRHCSQTINTINERNLTYLISDRYLYWLKVWFSWSLGWMS